MNLHHDERYFREQYAADPDPWGFDDRWYERRKYAVTLAALPRSRYQAAFEPGCANGALTELLAPRCDRLEASELVDDVAARARRRLSAHQHVTIVAEPFPQYWPDQELDLVVLSEVAYYLTAEGRRAAESAIRRRLAVGGDLIAVHYTGETDYPMRGADVALWLDDVDGLDRLISHVDRGFDLGVWRRQGDRAR